MCSCSSLPLSELYMKKKENSSIGRHDARLAQRRKYVEMAAVVGLLLVLMAMAAPFLEGFIGHSLVWARWVYAAGALVYTVARVVNVNAPGDSLRLRRLRRLEFWAGMCFIVGAAFWFYKMQYYSGLSVGPLAVLRQTVAFTMAGAVLQIVSSWMVAWQMKKEN